MKTKLRILLTSRDKAGEKIDLNFPADIVSAASFEEAHELIQNDDIDALITDDHFLQFLGDEQKILDEKNISVLQLSQFLSNRRAVDLNTIREPELSAFNRSGLDWSPSLEKMMLQEMAMNGNTGIFLADVNSLDILKAYKPDDVLFDLQQNPDLKQCLQFVCGNTAQKEVRMQFSSNRAQYELKRKMLDWNGHSVHFITVRIDTQLQDAQTRQDQILEQVVRSLPNFCFISDGSKLLFANEAFIQYCRIKQIENWSGLQIRNDDLLQEATALNIAKENRSFTQASLVLVQDDQQLEIPHFKVNEFYYQSKSVYIVSESIPAQTADVLKAEDFMQIASHDLREPLRLISGYAHLIKRKLNQANEEEIRAYADIILSSGKTLDEYLKKLKEVSRPEESDHQAVPLMFSNAIKQIQQQYKLENKDVAFEFIIQEDAEVWMSEKDLLGLLKNMLSISFSNTQMKVTHRVLLSARLNQRSMVISLRDNGKGLSSGLKGNFENAFRQLNFSTEDKRVSLCYNILKGIAQHYNGEVWIDSESGMGTQITISMQR